jgi:hypothetical protein
MVDRYTPGLDGFELSDAEKQAIELALATDKPWDWGPPGPSGEAIKALKVKIRDYHLQRHGNRCCYCRVNLHGAGPFMTDREHILPKSIESYRPYTYAMWNLGIACKRCNMEYKKDKDDFVASKNDPASLLDSANYSFIHPNFDFYKEHLSRFAVEADDAVLVKYTLVNGSTKGAFTYTYFNLRGLEVESFDLAQGLRQSQEPGEAALEIRALAGRFGQ